MAHSGTGPAIHPHSRRTTGWFPSEHLVGSLPRPAPAWLVKKPGAVLEPTVTAPVVSPGQQQSRLLRYIHIHICTHTAHTHSSDTSRA